MHGHRCEPGHFEHAGAQPVVVELGLAIDWVLPERVGTAGACEADQLRHVDLRHLPHLLLERHAREQPQHVVVKGEGVGRRRGRRRLVPAAP